MPCLLIHRKPGALLGDFEQIGIPIYQHLIKHSLDLRYLLRLRKQLLQNGVQVVHAQLPLDAVLAYWACLGTGIKLVLSVHGYDVDYGKLVKRMLGFILRRADLTLFVSREVQRYYVGAYKLSTSQQCQQVLYNGINFSKFDQPSKSCIRTKLGIPPDSVLLGSVGNFVAVRDQFTICHFLGELKKRSINVQFIFVGARNEATPALYDTCVSYCAGNELTEQVHFLGSRSDVPAILSELDAFVYASNHDTFGIAVVEAMAVGLPVFVNDCAVMREITQNGQWATLYKTCDVADLTTKFLPFLQAQSHYRKQAELNADFVRQTFSIAQHVQILQNHYRALLQ